MWISHSLSPKIILKGTWKRQLEEITRKAEIDLLQQLGEATIPSPVAPVDGVYLPWELESCAWR